MDKKMNYKRIIAGVLACTMVIGAANFGGASFFQNFSSCAEDAAAEDANTSEDENTSEEEDDSVEDIPYDEPDFSYTLGEEGYLKYRKYADHITIYEFDKSTKERNIVVPETIEDLPVKSIAYGTFAGAQAIKSVTLPDTIETIEMDAFTRCYSLTEINFPAQLKRIGKNAFASAHIRIAELPEGLTTIGDSAFSGCEYLNTLTIPDTVTAIGQSAFQNCYKITSVSIPGSVKKIPKYAFNRCLYMTELELGEGVKSIGYSAFGDCKRLETVTFPEGITTIGDHAFEECTALKAAELPDTVYSIGKHAFYKCKNMTDLKLSKNLASIESFAFSQCNSLKEVYVYMSTTLINVTAFGECASLEKITIENPECIMPTLLSSSAISNSVYAASPKYTGVICGYTETSTAARVAKDLDAEYINLGDVPPEYIKPTKPVEESDTLYGDANLDGKISIADAAAIMQFLGNADRFPLETQAYTNADCYEPGHGVTPLDAMTIQRYCAKVITELPVIPQRS